MAITIDLTKETKKEINFPRFSKELRVGGFYKVTYSLDKWIRVEDATDEDLSKVILIYENHLSGLSWGDIIKTRNSLLRESDFSVLPDVPFTYNEREAWLNYRQSLRDIPQNFDMPDSVIWPEKPV